MSKKVNDALVQAEGASQAMNNNKGLLIAKGGQKKMDQLEFVRQDLVKKNSTQVAAETAMEQKTAAQDQAVRDAHDAISQLQEAAKSAFTGDKVKLKEFSVGIDKPENAKGTITLLDYLTGVAQKYHDDLVENGMTDEDITNLSTIYAALVAANAVAENAKKLRNAATETRDASLAALKKTINATRNFAKAALKGNKAALEEFKPIPKGRGKRKGGTPPPALEPPQSK